MIIYDFEVTKYDWLVCYLDTDLRKEGVIVNNKPELEEFYKKYKDTIFIGYNSRNYDQYILKGILAGFDPYKITDWIINQDRRGYEFSNLLNNFPLLNYDTSVGFRSLKELEAFMGHDIRESNIPFDIDRKLTDKELEEMIKYCKHDVWETFEVFVETKTEFESHIGLLKEFNLPITYISKTKAQLSAIILGANQKKRNDEFDISFPDTLQLGKYEWIKDWYINWSKNVKDYKQMELETEVGGIIHRFGIGGIHSQLNNYYGEGDFILADVNSYYPSIMIEYKFLSRNVSNPEKFKQILLERFKLKSENDPREYPRKIVLNSTYGASKDQYNALYDPLMANNVCIAGQLLLVDLIDKIEHIADIIQSNTDGVLFKPKLPEYKDEVLRLCEEWSTRTRMGLGYEEYVKVIQKDINNFIMVAKNGKIKRKGVWVKKLNPLDNDLPIVNRAIVDYLVNGVPVETTIMNSTNLIDFQKITKVSNKYDYAVYNGNILYEKVHRTFASKFGGATLYKKHKNKDTLDKTAGTPESCRIENGNVTELKVPYWLDRQFYIDLANERIKSFLGE